MVMWILSVIAFDAFSGKIVKDQFPENFDAH
jgi:hypothetical protein